MQQLFVINRNPEPHQDRYDGEEFTFMPNEAVLVPVEAAVHMFGYGLKDKTDALSRLGKAFRLNPGSRQFEDDPDGVRWLANFVFEEAVVQPRSALAQAVAEPDIA